jgi:2-polyprenyl-3-methyl-5-hydroxy-6-metoxy-1,4-benzoquinol methylase
MAGTLNKMKTAVRKIGSRLGWVEAKSDLSQGRECPADWYDANYTANGVYHCRYPQSWYYFLWAIIADRLRRSGVRRVLEIGCGTAQLASLLLDQGVEQYTGLDFSAKAIAIARTTHRGDIRVDLVVGDARLSDIYESSSYEALICTEVLEHVEADLDIVRKFPPGKRCLCSVPNFPYESHVRHFHDAAEVLTRYGTFFNPVDVSNWKGPKSPTQEFFLLDGVRHSVT